MNRVPARVSAPACAHRRFRSADRDRYHPTAIATAETTATKAIRAAPASRPDGHRPRRRRVKQPATAAGITLDTGALIAVERRDPRVLAYLAGARDRSLPIAVPAGVVGQVWRASPRQAPIAQLLAHRHTTVIPLDATCAWRAGAYSPTPDTTT